MTVFVYDKTFEGLLTAVFDAYSRHSFPDLLLAEGEPFPLFYDEAVTICTDDAKVDRVWKGLQKRLSAMALSVITGYLNCQKRTCCFFVISVRRSTLRVRSN